MRLNDIRTLYDYLFWAHERMIAPVLEIEAEDFTRELFPGQGSLRDNLVRMMSCEWIWLSRWHGVSPPSMLDPGAFPTLEALEDRWGRIRVELQRFLGKVRESDLARPFAYRSIDGEDVQVPLLFSMEHLVDLNTYHRGQVAMLLQHLGRAPANTDLLLYYLEEEGGEFGRPTRRWEQTLEAAEREERFERLRRGEEEEDDD